MAQGDLSDRIRGCILAGAIGDSMGRPFEGQPGPLDYRDHAPWAISDDTQLTLATCESIIEIGCVDPEHVAARLVAWFREGRCTGIGASTLKALRDLDAGAHWALAGARGEYSCGNGAAMRIAPLAFHLDPEDFGDHQVLRDVCRITHHHEEAYVGALSIIAAIRCPSHEDLLSSVHAKLPDSRVRDRIAEIIDLSETQEVSDVARRFGASGYVVESVPLALFAAQSIAGLSLEEHLRITIEAGGDTDTIASITGQIVGSRIGVSRIPVDLLHRVPHFNEISRIANEFAMVSKRFGE
jgi:ADP-ribosylglycohydrolase